LRDRLIILKIEILSEELATPFKSIHIHNPKFGEKGILCVRVIVMQKTEKADLCISNCSQEDSLQCSSFDLSIAAGVEHRHENNSIYQLPDMVRKNA